MNVLFIDADDGVAESVSAVLRRKGHACETVGKGEDAIALIRQHDYDIIVLEIDLPDMNGFDVIQRMKHERIEVPVLLQSGQLNKGLGLKAAELRGAEIFAKPYIVTELIERMEQVIASAEEREPAFQDELSDDDQLGESLLEPNPTVNGSEPGHGDASHSQERRDDPRIPHIEAALIVDTSGPIPCVILNLSERGAALKLPEADRDCPSLFSLELLDGPMQRCEMRWRKGDRVGVAFI